MSGLSAGFMLRRKDVDVKILEAESYIGGFSHSFEWNGQVCDWAAHRLFTHDQHVLQQLVSLVPMERHNRRSAVRMGDKWLHDPVDVLQLCTRFFPGKTFSIPWTYLGRNRNLEEDDFLSYCYRKYGKTLGDFLFSPYTAKMFGIPPEEISVEWARKKVRVAGPLDALKQSSKTKFNYFYYPKSGGYGSIPNRMYDELKDCTELNAKVFGFDLAEGRIARVRYTQDGQERSMDADIVISTMPLTTLCGMLGHDPDLSYRAVSAVYFQVNRSLMSPNHWIYFMDGDCAINRLCEVKNMDPSLGPAEHSIVCCEVTNRDRPDFVDKAAHDLVATGMLTHADILDSTEVTREYSYPVYKRDYEKDVDQAMEYLARFSNLHTVGRAAQFEHMEVDDCFSSALHCTREILKQIEPSVTVAESRRSSLAVEPRVASVVRAEGDSEATLAALESLTRSDYGQHEIIVLVDTAADELTKLIRERYPTVRIVSTPIGLGIPAAFNMGCNVAVNEGADYVFFAHGNTRVEPDLLSQLVRVAQRDPEAGILTPKIMRHDVPNRIWSIGSYFRSFPPSIKTIGAGQPGERFVESREVEFAVSCGLLVKRETLEAIGLFDPGYGFYYEDVDFSMRARAAGFRIRFVPEAVMYFQEEEADKRTSEFYFTWGQSFALFYRRHMRPLAVKLPLHLAYLVGRECVTGGAHCVPALLKGIREGMHHRIGEIPKLDADFIQVI